jgi:uncharacterized protein YecE (DUF72 family)
MIMTVKVGTCGWGLKGGKEAYYSTFNVIELQDPFYILPQPDLARRWREAAPPDFEMNMKAWQAITHPATSPTWKQGKLPEGRPENIGLLKPTEENFRSWKETAEIVKILQSKVLVVQTPPKFDSTREHLKDVKAFFSSVKRPCAVGWETRGPWAADVVRKLCEDLNLIHIVDPFRHKPAVSTDIIYFRLHGIGPGEVNYKYKYTDADLRKLLGMVRSYEKTAREVYVMFNNITMGEDALRFKALLLGNK